MLSYKRTFAVLTSNSSTLTRHSEIPRLARFTSSNPKRTNLLSSSNSATTLHTQSALTFGSSNGEQHNPNSRCNSEPSWARIGVGTLGASGFTMFGALTGTVWGTLGGGVLGLLTYKGIVWNKKR